jgi:hypothetical protein
MREFMVLLAVALALAGCVSGPAIDYIRAEYTGIDVVPFAVGDDEYRVFDKPAANKLMITPSLAKSASIGVQRGATFGALDQSHVTKPYSDAAAAYLESTGRKCRVVSTELLARPQYEVKYDCSVPPAAAKPVPAKRRR